MATRRLSEDERTELEARRAKLALELKLIEGELRSDAVLPVAGGRSEGALRQRSEYLRKLYGRGGRYDGGSIVLSPRPVAPTHPAGREPSPWVGGVARAQ